MATDYDQLIKAQKQAASEISKRIAKRLLPPETVNKIAHWNQSKVDGIEVDADGPTHCGIPLSMILQQDEEVPECVAKFLINLVCVSLVFPTG